MSRPRKRSWPCSWPGRSGRAPRSSRPATGSRPKPTGGMIDVERQAADNRWTGCWSASATPAPRAGGWASRSPRSCERAGEHHARHRPLDPIPDNPEDRRRQADRQADRAAAAGASWSRIRTGGRCWPSRRSASSTRPTRRFGAWLKEGKPLSRLKSLRTILDLDDRKAGRAADRPRRTSRNRPPGRSPAARAGAASRPTAARADRRGHDRRSGRAGLYASTPRELTHATRRFWVARGAARRRVALQSRRAAPARAACRRSWSIARGTSAATPGPPSGQSRGGSRRWRRRRPAPRAVDVAVYTPGNPQGRPLSIAIAPAGLGLARFVRAWPDRAIRRLGPGRDDELQAPRGATRPGRRSWPGDRPARQIEPDGGAPRAADRLHRRGGPRARQRRRPARSQAVREARQGPGDLAAEPGRVPLGPGRAARRRGAAGARPACAAGEDAPEHHQHQVPGGHPGHPVLGLAAPGGAGPLGQPVAAPRPAPGGLALRRGRPLPARPAAAADQGADGRPAQARPFGRRSACSWPPRAPATSTTSAATTSGPGSSAASRRRPPWPR